ncbi:hypothetical protein MTO96_037456 [Rhipicephalus appendiculatus]
MQHAVGGRQAQAPVTYAPPVQSQPSTSGLQRYGAPSSFHRGNSPTRGPYSGSHNRWASAGSSGTDSSSYTSRPPATSSGSASSSYSSTSGSSHRGSGRGSWNSNNESGVGERHRPGVNPGLSQDKSGVQSEGANSNRKPAGAASDTDLSRFTTPLPEVKANHFKLDLNRQLVVYHYEVTIWWGEEHLSPETEAKLRLASRDKRRILAEFSKAHKIATNIFDGQKCLYSTKKLELNEETKTVHVQREIGEKIDEFYVRIRQVGILRYDSQENCRKNAQALDIAIRCALSHNREFLGRLLLRKVTNESAPHVQPTTPRSRPPAVRDRYNRQRANHSAKTGPPRSKARRSNLQRHPDQRPLGTVRLVRERGHDTDFFLRSWPTFNLRRSSAGP